MHAEGCWDNVSSKNSAKPCPICGKAAVEDTIPFCSKRCADRDLANWATGRYAVPAEEIMEDEASDPKDI